MRKTLYLLIGVLCLWLGLIVYQSCSEPKSEAVMQVETSWPEGGVYLGSEACQSCHETEYADWVGSHHDLAMAEASDVTVRGDFSGATFGANRFSQKDGAYVVTTEGPDGTTADFEVAYTFGWEPLQQYLVRLPGGRLQALHLAWDTEQEKWFHLYPNEDFEHWDWMHWTGGSMTWNAMCADCHSTNLEKNYLSEEDTYETTWSVINVGCESCHGPGEKHVAQAETDTYRKGEYLLQAREDPSVIQIENCAPCHSRRTMISDQAVPGERFLDHYIPDLLSESLYHADGQIDEEVYVYGSFLQSKMYLNGVKCTDCHNPHSGQLLVAGNALCVNCHTAKYDRQEHHFHALNTEASQCVSCHMPGKNYMVNDFRRDHSFRVPRPDLSVGTAVPNACNGCHSEQSDEWAAKAVEQWYGEGRSETYADALVSNSNDFAKKAQLIQDASQPAITRAAAIGRLVGNESEEVYQTIVASLGDREGLVRIAALNALVYLPLADRVRLMAPLLDDPLLAVRVTVGGLLSDAQREQLPIAYQPAWEDAVKQYRVSLRRNEDFPSGQFQIGQYHDRRNEDLQAIKAYMRALQLDSLLPGPRQNLARLYSRQGQNDLALVQLENAKALNPTDPNISYSLALLLAEEQQFEQARLELERVISMGSPSPRVYYNLGLVIQRLGDFPEAAQVFREGLNRFPQADDIRYALSTLLVDMGQYDTALVEIDVLVQKYPNNSDLRNLQQSVKAMAGSGSEP